MLMKSVHKEKQKPVLRKRLHCQNKASEIIAS